MHCNQKSAKYEHIVATINALIDGQSDAIAVLSTVVCELHHGISYFHWTGFYRVTEPKCLSVGPYQGTHGCLYIPFDKGICGRSARLKTTIIINNVSLESDHIACSSSTVSEIVVPLIDSKGNLAAVLDVDSDFADAFDQTDQHYLEQICKTISQTIYA